MSTYLQTTATECGLACLGYVAAHHGRVLSMNELRARFVVSMRGMSLADLARLGSAIGLIARPLRLEMHELTELTLPCVLHWDMSHFVVLKRLSRGKLTIFDPACGEQQLPMSVVSKHFTGIALELSPAPDFEPRLPHPAIGWRQLVGRLNGL